MTQTKALAFSTTIVANIAVSFKDDSKKPIHSQQLIYPDKGQKKFMGIRALKKPQTSRQLAQDYKLFDQLDGQHPWMKVVPEGYVPYKVRELRTGEVAYFNFVLAKEMGLIPGDHPHEMTEKLKEKILSTFSIQIINEYDTLSQKRIDPSTIKPNPYMASRYLQLQHQSKSGKTSGDGRGIWNGVIDHRGKIWDVSSRGTGVTCLSPGYVAANRPLKTGGTEFGYGCGLAEIDELYGAAILAETMHLQGIHTERVLCVIDLGKGYGIGVRAAPNLLRPAHLFLYLKQNRIEALKRSVDYFIDRQIKNGKWANRVRGGSKYDDLADEICRNFAQFTAVLDIDYIFAWLDWDGDNMLTDAGIIDYGSVRQFGIRHDQYRYDDVERFSTNLNEQRLKARLIVQVFAQICDYVKTGKKKPLKAFAKSSVVTKFNTYFKESRAHRLLYRIGFNEIQRKNIIANKHLFEEFDKEYSFFEKAKIAGKVEKVADGVNHPALFNMRSLMRTLPEFYLKKGFDQSVPTEEFFRIMLSTFAKEKDTKLRSKHRHHIENFQSLYKKICIVAAGKQKPEAILRGISERSLLLNREDRITGNALIQIVFEIINEKKKGMNHSQIQSLIDQLIFSHLGQPEVNLSRFYVRKPRLIVRPDVYNRLMVLVDAYREDI